MEETIVQSNLDGVQVKAHFTGKVTKVTLAGALVDIGLAVPGVLHISQLSKDEVKRVEDVVQVGQEVEVWVKRVMPKKQRIDLTMIRPLDVDWREVEIDQVYKGKVVRLEKFGAFVDIGAERPGLVHISEMTHDYIKEVSEVIKEGDEVEVKVLDVDRKKKQIKLSMKALVEKPEKLIAAIQERTERRPERGGSRRREREENAAAMEAVSEMAEREEPVPTAMEMALRQAMERKREDSPASVQVSKKQKGSANELENILERTLKHKVAVK